jgi:gamma-D-glutamyl-L-lysine dipeptidyl-peptidase
MLEDLEGESRSGAQHAFVRAAVAPILARPVAGSVQISQALSGHVVVVLGAEGPWMRVRAADDYEGWVHHGYLSSPRPPRGPLIAGWDRNVRLSLGCVVRGHGGVPRNLPLGGLLHREEDVESGRAVGLEERRRAFPTEVEAIVNTAVHYFAGTYYQWGGVTPWGADCSGFVQSTFALHGVRLPRDAWQQASIGEEVVGGLTGMRTGDLLFFQDHLAGRVSHVALAMSNQLFVHLSIGRGGYSIEHVDEPDPFVTELLSRFVFARRVI